MKKAIILLIVCLCFPVTTLARRGAPPISRGKSALSLTKVKIHPTRKIDPKTLKEEDAQRVGPGPLRFAEPIEVDITPQTHGTWETLDDGSRLWRLRIFSPGATDLNFGFSLFNLPEGVVFHILSEKEDYYEGPYTSEDNRVDGQFWSPLIPGNRAVLELHVPIDSDEPAIWLTQISGGYRDMFKSSKMAGDDKSGFCNNDVICPEGDPWRDEIRSVAVYSLEGFMACTGTLVMDAEGSFRPYLLTANHCTITPQNAGTMVVYWNFESPVCGQLGGGTLAQNQTGATLLASRFDVDMALVELEEMPAEEFNVYYAGWDRSDTAPNGSVGIHHPNTDEKAISFNTDPLTTADSCIGTGGFNTHWLVDNWEDGTTEPGSSGSGLWDPDTHYLVGFLSGGLASCDFPEGYDCYGKFSVAWDGADASQRLSDWLDPAGTGVLMVNGSNPGGSQIDITPPTPDPAEWAVEPQATGVQTVTMESVVAQSASGGVQYFFDCQEDDAFDSDWQDSPHYTRSDCASNSTYTFTVTYRDINGNTGQPSAAVATTTSDGSDTLPPAPSPAQWKALPRKLNSTMIGMEAREHYDESGVEYYFECTNTTDPAHAGDPSFFSSPDWQDSPVYIATGASISSPGNLYTFRVKVRDLSPGNYESTPSSEETAIMAPPPRQLEVPSPYSTIADAVGAANHGDTIIVHPGTYTVSEIDFLGKAITIRSEAPDNPDVVAATVLDGGSNSRAFVFMSGETRNSAVNGFTIQNTSAVPNPSTPPASSPDPNGLDAKGGAIASFNGSSPTISNCVFINCLAQGQNGADGFSGDDGVGGADGADGASGEDGSDATDGGHGGNGGLGYGGAMYFDPNSSPLIKSCQFIDCNAIGGNAGAGGDGGVGGSGGNGDEDGNGGNGGSGGNAGNGGNGGNGAGGAMFFGLGCSPEIIDCVISGSSAQVGLGNYGGAGGDGGSGGDGAGAGIGGIGGNGGNGGHAGMNGSNDPNFFSTRSDTGAWGGAICFSANCSPLIEGTVFENNASTDLAGDSEYYGGDGGNGGNGGAGGGADGAGGNGGDGANAGDGNQAGAGGAGGTGNPGGSDGASASPEKVNFSGGGAIFYGVSTQTNLIDCTFTGNRAVGFSGGAEFYDSETIAIYSNCTYQDNQAGGAPRADGSGGGAGGGIYTYNMYNLTCTGCVFEDNTAFVNDHGGGALSIDSSVSGGIHTQFTLTDCEFIGNTAGPDHENVVGSNYGGAIYAPDTDGTVTGSSFVGNISEYGGAVFMLENVITFADCEFEENVAEYGGALYWYDSDVTVRDSQFSRNRVENAGGTGDFCSGGAMYILEGSARIFNSRFLENEALGYGGAIYMIGTPYYVFGGVQDIVNCLMYQNESGLGGGAVMVMNSAEPFLINCTMVENTVTSAYGYGGAVGCEYNHVYDESLGMDLGFYTYALLENSILWDNLAAFGPQAAVGDPLDMENELVTLELNHSDIQGGIDDIYLGEPIGNTWAYDAGGVIDADPLFAAISVPTEPEDVTFYLSQIAAGQLENSPCLNAGIGDPNSVLDSELGFKAATRTDHVAEVDSDVNIEVDPPLDDSWDPNVVNMGFHYDASGPVAEYTLRTSVYVADLYPHGTLEVTTEPNNLIATIDPNTSTYLYQFKQGTVVELRATPDEHYRVARWIGTDNVANYFEETNTITITGIENVQVEFELAVPRNLYVPEIYATIEEAVGAAHSGDTIILSPRLGQPYQVFNPEGINFGGKQVHLRSKDPNDPAIVASTIIDCQGSRYVSKRAFLFDNGEDPNTIIEGITIRNAFTAVIGPSAVLYTGPWPPLPDISNPPPDRAWSGMDGTGDSYGGAILCENGSSPTIRNCVFEDCTVAGGIGGDGADGYPPPNMTGVSGNIDSQSGGHSGKGTGNGYGGAIAVLDQSNPMIIGCTFTNNRATGGWGGIPGDAGGAYGSGRYGWGGNDWDGILDASLLWGINPEAGYGEGDGRGGAIFVDADCKPLIYNCTFEGNYARPGYVYAGGAESPSGGAYPEPWDANPWGNEGARTGRYGYLTDYGTIAGGAVFFGNEADSELKNCTFIKNSAYDVYSYIDFSGYEDLFDLAEFKEYTRGGAVFADPNVTLDIRECKFTENYAGALFCSTGAALTVDDSDFTNNHTSEPEEDDTLLENLGFALIVYPGETVARDLAGAITIDRGSEVASQISNSRFSGNISEASGGAILTYSDIEVANSQFNSNSAVNNGGAFYSYDHIPGPDTHTTKLDFYNCEFSANEALGLGGAVYTRTAILDVEDCFFLQNEAASGGGLYAVYSNLEVQGAMVYGNEAVGVQAGAHRTAEGEGSGGGIFVMDCNSIIADSRISHNIAHGVIASGGGVCFAGGQTYKSLNMLNCLVAGNESQNTGGGLSCQQNASVDIDNCTIANNISDSDNTGNADDPDNKEFGGGIYVDHTSDVSLRHSIVTGNKGYGIYEKQPYGVTDTGGDSDASYTLFYGNELGDLFDAQTNQALLGSSGLETIAGYMDILDDNPVYSAGPLGSYYLNQLSSPAKDAGNNTPRAVGIYDDLRINRYTTDPTDPLSGTVIEDGGSDGKSDPVDLGYHYFIPDPVEDRYDLTANVQYGAGTVEPASGTYYRGAIVDLAADVDDEYFLTGWSGGTVEDNSKEAENVVLMTRDKDVLVLVRIRKTLKVGESHEYDTLGDAFNEAEDGDIILIAPGTYVGATQNPSALNSIYLIGKQLTISGSNPDDESVVRATIFNDVEIYFGDVDEKTIIEGITIGGSRMELEKASPTIRNCVFTDCRWTRGNLVHQGNDIPGGTDGFHQSPILGGAIHMVDSSPKIINCVFENNAVFGADGEDGFEGDDDHPNGGDGGFPGAAYGGAVYCGLSSNPEFIQCRFIDNEVFGGNGGDGADYVTLDNVRYDGGRGGGWIYDDEGEEILAFGYFWDGWTFNNDEEKYYASFYSQYMREYDFDVWARWFNWDESYTSWAQFDSTYTENPYDAVMDAWRYSGYGGAVYCEFDSDAKFIDCEFEDNQSHGGLTGIGGDQPLTREWPDRQLNMPTAGGAVFASHDSDVEFEGCTFRNNLADKSLVDLPHTFQTSFGGAVGYEFNCDVKFTDCDFSGNDATVGGGIYGFGSMATIVDCNVSNNEAYIGAGMYFDDDKVDISGTVIRANNAKPPEPTIIPPTDPDDDPTVVPSAVGVTGQGAGIYALVLNLDIRDSVFIQNNAQLTGGGLLLSGTVEETSEIFNCLFAENISGRDGAGASVNWLSRASFGNCTFDNNNAQGIYREVETGEFEVLLDPITGEPVLDDDDNPILVPVTVTVQDSPGFGGGLYCSYDSVCEVFDCIFWNNQAGKGDSIYLGAGTIYEPRPSELTISYSDVENYSSDEAIFVEEDCPAPTIGPGMIDQDPEFLTHPEADVNDVTQRYYLDQDESPCVDAGSRLATVAGLSNYVTSIFKENDEGIVDMGYHYRILLKNVCSPVDLVLNGKIDIQDWAAFALEWLTPECGNDNDWCNGRDFNYNTVVDFNDVILFAGCWLKSDEDPPNPNPSEWEIQPTEVLGTFDRIQMRAKLHQDDWWPDDAIEYYFDCVDPFDGPDRDWGSSRDYTASNLAPGPYSYVVKVRDGSGLETTPSPVVIVTPGENTIVPQALWDQLPTQAATSYSVTMKADSYSSFGNPPLGSGYVMKYEFTELNGATGGNGRAYDTSRTHTDSGLAAGETYSYQVRMGLFYEPGDGTSTLVKEGEWSDVADITIDEVDTTPPTPDPAQHVSGSPYEQVFYVPSFNGNRTQQIVTAVAAQDDSDVEYWFECVSNSAFSSGGSLDNGPQWRNVDSVAGLYYWDELTPQIPEVYWANRGLSGIEEEWVIHVRDRSPAQNATAPSEIRTIFNKQP